MPISALEFDLQSVLDVNSKHNSEELCTAVKPFFAQSLLAKGVQQILYLDPDVVVLRRLHEVTERLKQEDSC